MGGLFDLESEMGMAMSSIVRTFGLLATGVRGVAAARVSEGRRSIGGAVMDTARRLQL